MTVLESAYGCIYGAIPDETSKVLTYLMKIMNQVIDEDLFILTEDNIEKFNEFMKGMSVFYLQKKEQLKVDFLTLMSRLMVVYST